MRKQRYILQTRVLKIHLLIDQINFIAFNHIVELSSKFK